MTLEYTALLLTKGKRKILSFLLMILATSVFAEDFTWTGPVGGIWGEALWNTSAYFKDGSHAYFTGESSANVVIDNDIVVSNLVGNVDTTISAAEVDTEAWKVAYKYYRFIIDGPKSDTGNMQFSEIVLIGEGGADIPSSAFTLGYDTNPYGANTLPYPDREKPTMAVDGKVDTKWLDWRAGLGRTSAQNAAAYLEFQFPSPTKLSGYKWFTANDSPGRDPVAWRLIASHDGSRWVTVDKVKDFKPTEIRKVLAFQRSFAGFSKYRFKIDGLRDGGTTMQISDVSLYAQDGTRLKNGVDFSVSYASTTSNPNAGEGLLKAVDSESNGAIKTNSKWLDHRLNNNATRDDVWIQFDLNTPQNISAYSWSTGGDTSKYNNRNPSSWRLFASNDGETWATLDFVTNNTSVTTSNQALAYKWDFLQYGHELRVDEIHVANGKTVSILPGLRVSNRPYIIKKGAGDLKMGGDGTLLVTPYNGFTVSEGRLEANDITFRLGGDKTANHNAQFVIGNKGIATAVVNGGSIYSVGPGSGNYDAFNIASDTGDKGYFYATNVNITTRGRLRVGVGENSYAYVEKVGGDWRVEENHSYGRFLIGNGKDGNSEFYHRSGTLTTMSYICVGVNSASTAGRNYFEISGGTVSQESNNDIRIGDSAGKDVHNELAVKGGLLKALTHIRVCNNGRGILTVDGGEVDASNGSVIIGGASEVEKVGIVNLNGGILKTQSILGGASNGQVNWNGGNVFATADGAFLPESPNLICSVGSNGGSINNNSHTISISEDFTGAGTLTLAGVGTTEFLVNQTGADVTWRLAEGDVKIYCDVQK